jgi:hypothetical protein
LPHEQLGCILDNEPFCFKLDVDALTQPDFAVERLNAAQSCARIGSIVEHVAGVEDYQLALATFLAVFPASGSSRKRFARDGVFVNDLGPATFPTHG